MKFTFIIQKKESIEDEKNLNKTIYQESEWLKTSKSIYKFNILFFYVNYNDIKIGEIILFEKNFYLFKVWGSPIRGTMTGPMGLVLIEQFEQQRNNIYQQFFLFVKSKFPRTILVELLDQNLNPNEFINKNTICEPYTGYKIDLSLDLDEIYSKFDRNVKRKIKKAELNNLVVKKEEISESLINDYYSMTEDVFLRKNKKVPKNYSLIKKILKAKDTISSKLICLSVYNSQGERIAIGIFTFNEFSSYFWATGSYTRSLELCPNEVIHKEGIRLIKELGVKYYEFGGGMDYKKRYGPDEKIGSWVIFSPFESIAKFKKRLFLFVKKLMK